MTAGEPVRDVDAVASAPPERAEGARRSPRAAQCLGCGIATHDRDGQDRPYHPKCSDAALAAELHVTATWRP